MPEFDADALNASIPGMLQGNIAVAN